MNILVAYSIITSPSTQIRDWMGLFCSPISNILGFHRILPKNQKKGGRMTSTFALIGHHH